MLPTLFLRLQPILNFLIAMLQLKLIERVEAFLQLFAFGLVPGLPVFGPKL
jgi:hypothetical protein